MLPDSSAGLFSASLPGACWRAAEIWPELVKLVVLSDLVRSGRCTPACRSSRISLRPSRTPKQGVRLALADDVGLLVDIEQNALQGMARPFKTAAAARLPWEFLGKKMSSAVLPSTLRFSMIKASIFRCDLPEPKPETQTPFAPWYRCRHREVFEPLATSSVSVLVQLHVQARLVVGLDDAFLWGD